MKEHVILTFSLLILVVLVQKVHTNHISEEHNGLASENDSADTKDDEPDYIKRRMEIEDDNGLAGENDRADTKDVMPDYIKRQMEVTKPIGYYNKFKTIAARRSTDQDRDQSKDNVPIYIKKLPVETVKSNTVDMESKLVETGKSAVNFKKSESFIRSDSDFIKEKTEGYVKHAPVAIGAPKNLIHSKKSQISETRQSIHNGNDTPDFVQKSYVKSEKHNKQSTKSKIDQKRESRTEDNGGTGNDIPDYIQKAHGEIINTAGKKSETIRTQEETNNGSSNTKDNVLDSGEMYFDKNAIQEIISSTETKSRGFNDEIQKPSIPNETEPKTVESQKKSDSDSGGIKDVVQEYAQKLIGATVKPASNSVATELGDIQRRTYDDSRSTDDEISEYLKKLPSQTGKTIVYSKKTKTLETHTDGNDGNGDTKDDMSYSIQKLPAKTVKYSTKIIETGTDKTQIRASDDSDSTSGEISDSSQKNSGDTVTSSMESEIISARKQANGASSFPNDVKDYINKLLTEKAKADTPAESGRVKKTYKVVITKTRRNKTISQPSEKFFRTHKVVENQNRNYEKNNNVSVTRQSVTKEPNSHTIVRHNYEKVTHNYNTKSNKIVDNKPELLLLKERSREKSNPYLENIVSRHEFVNEKSSNGEIYPHDVNVAPQKMYTIKYTSKTNLKPNLENVQYEPGSSKIEKTLKVTNMHKFDESKENDEVLTQELGKSLAGDDLLKNLPPVPYKRLNGTNGKESMIVVPLPYKPFGSFIGEDGKESMIFVPVSQKQNGNFKGKETLISHIRKYVDEEVYNPDIQFAKTYRLSEQLPQKRQKKIDKESIKTTTTRHVYKDIERDADHALLKSQPDNTIKESQTFSQLSYEPNSNEEKYLKTESLLHHPSKNQSEKNIAKIKEIEFSSNKIKIIPDEDSLNVIPLVNNSDVILSEKDDERTLVSQSKEHKGEDDIKPVDLEENFERIKTDEILKSHKNIEQENKNEVVSSLREPNHSSEDKETKIHQTLYDSFEGKEKLSQSSRPQENTFVKEQLDSVTEDILFPRFVDAGEKKDIQLTDISHNLDKDDMDKESALLSQFKKNTEKQDLKPQNQNEEVTDEIIISKRPVDYEEGDEKMLGPQHLNLRERLAKIISNSRELEENDKEVLISQLEKISQQPVEEEITEEILRPKTENTKRMEEELSPQLFKIESEELLFKSNKTDLSHSDGRKGIHVEFHEVSKPEAMKKISEDDTQEIVTAKSFGIDHKKPKQQPNLDNIISEVCSGVRSLNRAWDIIDKMIPLNLIYEPEDLSKWKELYSLTDRVLASLINLKDLPISILLEEILQHTRYRILELLLSQLDENAYPYFRLWNNSKNINDLGINIDEFLSIIEKHMSVPVSDKWNYKHKPKLNSDKDEWLPKIQTNVLREKLLVNVKDVPNGAFKSKHLSDADKYQSENVKKVHQEEFSLNPNSFDHEWNGWEPKNELKYPLNDASKQKHIISIQDGYKWEIEKNIPKEVKTKPEKLTSIEWNEWNPKNNFKVHLEKMIPKTEDIPSSTGWEKFEYQTEKIHPEKYFYKDGHFPSFSESNKYKNENEIKTLHKYLLLPTPKDVLSIPEWGSVEKQNIHLEKNKLKPDHQIPFPEVNNWQFKNELFPDVGILKGGRIVPLRNWDNMEHTNQLDLNSDEIFSNHKKSKNNIKIHLDATISDLDGNLHIPRWLKWQPQNEIEIQREKISSNQKDFLPLPESNLCRQENELHEYPEKFVSTSNYLLDIPDCSNLNAYKIGINPEKTESAELLYLPDSYDHPFDLFHLTGVKETRQTNLKEFAVNTEHLSFPGLNHELVTPSKYGLHPGWDNWEPKGEVEIYPGDTKLKHNLIPTLQEGSKWEFGLNPEENELYPGLLHHTEWNGWQPEMKVNSDRFIFKSDDFMDIPIWGKSKSHYDIDIHPEISSGDDNYFYLPETKARQIENGLVHENLLSNPSTFSPSGWNEWQTENGLHTYPAQTILKPNNHFPLPECSGFPSQSGIDCSLQNFQHELDLLPRPRLKQSQNENSLNIHQEEFSTEINDFLTNSGWNLLKTHHKFREYPEQTESFHQAPLQMNEITDQVILENTSKPHPLRPLFNRILDLKSLKTDVALLNLQNVFKQVLRHLKQNDIPKEEVHQITSDMMREVLNEMKEQIVKCRVAERYENLAKTLETMLKDYFYKEYNYVDDSVVSIARQQNLDQGWILNPWNPQNWHLKSEIQVKR